MKLVRFTDITTVPASHEDPKAPGVLKKVLLQAADLKVGHVQMINWATLLPKKSFRNHYHEDMQEIFIMLDDGAYALINGKTVELLRGDALVVDPGEHHEMQNSKNTPVDYVVFGIAGAKKGNSVNV